MVLCGNGIGQPRKSLLSLVGHQDQGSEAKVAVGSRPHFIPHANTRFSLVHNDVFSPIYGVGPGVELPSFIFKNRMREDNVGFNTEAGFRCAMSALERRVEYRAIPHSYMTINETPIHFVGEKDQRYSEIVVEGDMNADKFIVWYIWGEEVVGFLTVGYQNLYLYLWEAMKLLIMPTAMHLRSQVADHKGIVAQVLRCRPEINAKRKEILKLPAVKITEFERERERLDEFKGKLQYNLEEEKMRQKQKMAKLKQKYDKEGISVVDDVAQMGDQHLTENQKRKLHEQTQQQRQSEAYERARDNGTASKSLMTRTKSGKGYKPGGAYGRGELDLANADNQSINMGELSNRGRQQPSENPVQAVLDFVARGQDPKGK